MPVSLKDMMTILSRVAEQQKMKAAFKQSGRGALLAGASAFVGGLMGGPPGIAVGGAVGALLGAWMSSEQFKPVAQIIQQLPPVKKQQLYQDAYALIRNVDWMDVAQLTALVMGNAGLRQQMAGLLLNFFTKELGTKIQCGK